MPPSPLLPSAAISTGQNDFKLAQYKRYPPHVAPPIVPALGTRALLPSSSSAKPEWPQIILRFQQYVVPKYESSLNQETPFPKRTGLLPHVAVAENNLVVLEILLKLSESLYSKRMPKINFSRVLRCAAYFGRLRMLKWLHFELSQDPEWTWELDLLASAYCLKVRYI